MGEFSNFLSLYLQNFGFFDQLVWLLGILAVLYQGWAWWNSREVKANRGPDFDEKFLQLKLGARFANLAIDGLPLIGLLGTIAALLLTFASMTDGVALGEIIPKFAPGLTSTCSGLLWAVVNLVFFNLLLQPKLQEFSAIHDQD